MSNRVVIQTEHASNYVDHECIRYHGTEEFLRINIEDAVYSRVWKTKDGCVIVNIDHEELEIEDAEIVESKLYRDTDNE